MKKIALVRSTYSPFGGAERVALGTARGLLDRNIQVTILTMPHQEWPLRHPGLTVVPLGLFHTHRLLQAWSFNHAVTRHLRNVEYDAVFSLDKVVLFSHLHAGGGTHKTFLEIKNRSSGSVSRLLRRFSPFHKYILYLERKGFENPLLKKVRCNSQMVKENIQAEYSVPEHLLTVIHSGIRWREMEDVYRRRRQEGEKLRQRHGIRPEWACLLFLGSGFGRKGLEVAIRGLGVLPERYHLVVVGKGAPKAYIRLAEQLSLAHRVHFLGPQPQGWRYASFCRALVLPSHYDPFGGAAAEGHAMGIPVLVSDATGYADWVQHGENGILLKTPMTEAVVRQGFRELLELIASPRRTPDELRAHAAALDDDRITDRLMEEFLLL